jgi:hypothetical protein
MNFKKQMGEEVCPNLPSKTKIQIYTLNIFSTNYFLSCYYLDYVFNKYKL